MKSPVKQPDVVMQDVERSPPSRDNQSPLQHAANTLARFKETQDLKIEIKSLAEGKKSDKKSPKPPPSSTGKKRRRRMASQIDRKFSCDFPGCHKAYGSEGSLTQHRRLKHNSEDGEKNNKQVGAFYPPLQHSISLPTASTAFEAPPTPRTVTIRPAATTVVFSSSPSNQDTNDQPPSPSEGPPSAKSQKSQRQNLRLRSNSMPVASSAGSCSNANKKPAKPRSRTKKPRRASTPHPKKIAAARPTKNRSKSESLAEMLPNALNEVKITPGELKMPTTDRSISDSTASLHDGMIPISTSSTASFEWPTTVSSNEQRSSDDHAIDSDILSVLANCEPSDLGNPMPLELGPPSFHSTTSFGSEDAEMLPMGMECFNIAENAPTVIDAVAEPTDLVEKHEPEPPVGLNAFATLDDDWANMHLAHHLQRMTVASASPRAMNPTLDRLTTHEDAHTAAILRSASDPSFSTSRLSRVTQPFSTIPVLGHFPSVQAEDNIGNLGLDLEPQQPEFPVQATLNPQQWHGGTPVTSDAVKAADSNLQQMLWMSSEPNMPPVMETGNQQQTSLALDEMLQHEDDWKENKFSATNAFQSGVFEGDSGIDYGLGDPGLTSALMCQREEL